MKLAKITAPPKKGTLVARQLLQEFHAARMMPGQRLPAERELAERLGVSRTIVREALSALQMAGVIESRVGNGTYIAEGFAPGAPSAPPLLKNLDASVSVVEALQAREALDISAAHLAIENAKPRDLEALDALMARLRRTSEAGEVMRYLDATLDLHIAIAQAGGNSVLEQVVTYLIDLVRPHLWIIVQNYNPQIMRDSLAIHAAMVDAIKSRDIQAAIASIHQHYHEYPSLQH